MYKVSIKDSRCNLNPVIVVGQNVDNTLVQVLFNLENVTRWKQQRIIRQLAFLQLSPAENDVSNQENWVSAYY